MKLKNLNKFKDVVTGIANGLRAGEIQEKRQKEKKEREKMLDFWAETTRIRRKKERKESNER